MTREVRGSTSFALVLFLLFLVAGLMATACGSSTSPEVGVGPDGTPEAVLVEGRTVFVDRCSSCHGASGGGTRKGPRLNRGLLEQQYEDPKDAAAVVLEGRNGMPAFDGLLTPDEVDAALRYIREVL